MLSEHIRAKVPSLFCGAQCRRGGKLWLAPRVRRECGPQPNGSAKRSRAGSSRTKVRWRVLDVAWSGDYQEMVVFYYDIDGVSEEELKEIEDTDDFALSELHAVEVLTFKEVLVWIKAAS